MAHTDKILPLIILCVPVSVFKRTLKGKILVIHIVSFATLNSDRKIEFIYIEKLILKT